jgi:hypothetical protein
MFGIGYRRPRWIGARPARALIACCRADADSGGTVTIRAIDVDVFTDRSDGCASSRRC